MPPPKDKIIEPIPDTLGNVVEKLIQPAGVKQSNNSGLPANIGGEPAPGHQYILDVDVEVEKVVDGVEMGVLGNGIPYLPLSILISNLEIGR